MISKSRDSSSSLFFYISRPVKVFLKRFSLGVFVILSLFGLFISKSNGPLAYTLRSKTIDALSPALSAIATPVNFFGNINESFRSYLFVHGKNKELMDENRHLRKKLLRLSGVSYENKELTDLLNYVKNLRYKYVSATAIGNMSDPFSHSILVNAGQNDGIKKGQAVVNETGLVGRVIEVGTKSSRVLLLTDINSNIPVITNKARERSIMSGNNSNTPELLYLPKGSELSEGEAVLTSGDGDIFPPDLQIGTIHIEKEGVYKVVPFAQRNRLEHLSIIDYSR